MRRSRKKAEPRELTAEERQTKELEEFVQDIKIIDIKRRSIQSYTKRIPWIIAGAVVAGIPFALSLVAISPIMIFIFGALFSGVMAQLIGPSGAFEQRRKAREAIEQRLDSLGSNIGPVLENYNPVLIAFRSVSKSAVTFAETGLEITGAALSEVDDDGAWAFGKHKFSGIVLREADGSLSASHPSLKGQYWINHARGKGHQIDQLNAALNAQVSVSKTFRKSAS